MQSELTYGVDFYQGQGAPFRNVTEQVLAVKGELDPHHSPVTMYDRDMVVELPAPDTMDTPVAAHVFGISHRCATSLYDMYVSVLRERTNLHDREVLRDNADVAYESPEVIDAVIRSSSILLENGPTFQQGINAWDTLNVQLAFSIGLQKIINGHSIECFQGYEVYFTTAGSYVDSFDQFGGEFSALNAFPGITPRLVYADQPMGRSGAPSGLRDAELLLIIPTLPGQLALQ